MANPAPQLKVTDLLPSELEALQAEGRINGDMVLPPPAPSPEELVKVDPTMIPEPPPELIGKSVEVKSTFERREQTLGGGENVTKSGEEPAPKAQENPDWAGAPPEDPITASEKATFLAAMLGNVPFQKTYELFGGAIKVTFRSRTPSLEAEAAKQMAADELLDGSFANVSKTVQQVSQQRWGRFMDYVFQLSLCRIETKGGVPVDYDALATPVKPGELVLRQARLAFDQKYPSPVAVAMRNAHQRFEITVAHLTREADNPDFWKAGSDS